jgi:ribonuclease HI
MRATQRRQLIRWLQIIIINSGFHLMDEASWTNSRAYSVNAHPIFDQYEWRFAEATEDEDRQLIGRPIAEKWSEAGSPTTIRSTITATAAGWGRRVQFDTASGTDRTHADLRDLQDATDGEVILAGHPILHHGPTLLVPKATYRQDRNRAELRLGLRLAAYTQRQEADALHLVLARILKAGTKDPAVQGAVQARSIAEIQTRAEGETDYQAIFRYRLAMGALNLRNNTGETLRCPHAWCETATQTLTVTHVVWDCDAAQRVWRLIHKQWARRLAPVEVGKLLKSSLGLDTPVLARDIRAEMGDEYDDRGLVAKTTLKVWKIIQAVTPHHLWLHRNAAAFQDRTDSVHGIAAKIWAAIVNQVSSYAAAKRVSSETYVESRVIDDIVRGIQADEPTESGDHGEARLYYDGGARGNPGPSGAGSILLERTRPNAPWLIVWWAAKYLGAAGTNNAAEHAALAQGLEEAARRYGDSSTTLDIIGDSMLVTRQLQDQIRETNRKFNGSAHRSRSALVRLYNYRFHHTLRTGNKMADWLANHAMDTQSTSTSTGAQRTIVAWWQRSAKNSTR